MAFANSTNNISSSIHGKLLHREIGIDLRSTNIPSFYGDRSWISNLDIVNELAGHHGCVNALSWSKSGNLLASGSDDTNLLIHKYQPEQTTRPFSLATCLATGHRQNIFSVKFMPHSNDRTLISCAADHEVRVFDLEYSGRSGEASYASSLAGVRSVAGKRNVGSLYQSVTYLSDGNTNSRVYRSHSDRVKRIVTESSPYLFLTCSEDGEVRQFDLRLPSSAYPRQSNSRTVVFNAGSQAMGNATPPLISYKKYHLDLNTISCSASQPHYIVLGGAHLHCFLHDRRMLGRDLTEERSSKNDSDMGTATRCVRRFAPDGKTVMNPRDPGHVTACKISDRNPNEMIASWSGDRIYGFNLIQADEMQSTKPSVPQKTKESRDRKRKRSTQRDRREDVVIRMRYENGQTEDFPVAQNVSQQLLDETRNSVLTERQRRSAEIGRNVFKIRKLLFSMEHSSNLSELKSVLSEVLSISSYTLQEMDHIMREWSYPLDPSDSTIAFEGLLRKHRDAARRFVQACGTLTRVLGGKIQTARPSPLLKLFQKIKLSTLERANRDQEAVFRYSFLEAILLWLEGGVSKLATEFRLQDPDETASASIEPNKEQEIASHICEMLANQVAEISECRIISVDNSRFERDETRIVFATELDAVKAFSRVITVPFEEDGPKAGESYQNRNNAMKDWGLKVCRGLLLNAGNGIDFASVDRAFGGLGTSSESRERSQEDIDPEAEDPVVSSAQVISVGEQRESDESNESDEGQRVQGPLIDLNDILQDEDTLEGEEVIFEEEDEEQMGDLEEANSDSDHDYDGDDNDNDDDDSIGYDGEDEDILESGIFFRGSAARSTLRAQVNKDLPCNPHVRMYQGHCNVKTVKDVNYFGLDDEYVVSGCDSGHLFIWDTKTSKLLNILKGDGEVVNVVQGHPYEPTLAVSGIDHTIKIFSPDNRAQHNARNGIDLGMPPNVSSGTSSLSYGLRRQPNGPTNHEPVVAEDRGEDLSSDELSRGGLSSKKRMQLSYSIISQNEVDRAGGNREAYITRDMLSQLTLIMHHRRQRATTGGGAAATGGNVDADGDEDDDDDESRVVEAALEDRCATM